MLAVQIKGDLELVTGLHQDVYHDEHGMVDPLQIFDLKPVLWSFPVFNISGYTELRRGRAALLARPPLTSFPTCFVR